MSDHLARASAATAALARPLAQTDLPRALCRVLVQFAVVALAVVLVAAGCGPAAEPGGPEDEAATPSAETVARIEAIEAALVPGIVIEGEEPVSGTLAERMEHHRVPGVSVAVIHEGAIDWARGWGIADIETGRGVTPDTLFQAASISKPIAAMAALSLVEEGLLELDVNVNDRLSSWTLPENEFTAMAPATLRRLVTHTAGMTVHGFPGYGLDESVPTVVGVLDGEGNTDPIRVDTEPGTIWRYSGGGYTVAQLLMSDAAGLPFPELMQERVLGPLGMTSSTYAQPLPAERHGIAAVGYRSGGDPVDGRWHTYPEMAAAGLWTTPTDLARYAMSVQAARRTGEHPVLSGETIDEMLTPGLNDHGLGPGISGNGTRFGHGGANEGYRCQLIAWIDAGKGVAIMTNSDSGSELSTEILFAVAREYGWEDLQPTTRSIAEIEPATYEVLVGTYRNEGTGEVVLELHEGRLMATLSWAGQSAELLPESDTVWFVRDSGMRVEVVLEDGLPVALDAGIRFDRVE